MVEGLKDLGQACTCKLRHSFHLVKGHAAVLGHEERGLRTPAVRGDGHGGSLTARGAALFETICIEEGAIGQMHDTSGHHIVVQGDTGVDEGEGDGIDGCSKHA